MCKVNTIIITSKLIGEWQSIVTFIWESVSSCLIFDIVLIVFYISSSTVPSNIFIFYLVYTIWKYSHTWIIKTVGLRQIYNIKTNFTSYFCVTNSKKIPLCMTVSINIILKYKIIFMLTYLNSNQKISWFKSWFKN